MHQTRPKTRYERRLVGVTWVGERHNKYIAQVRHHRKLYNLGFYEDRETAGRIRDVAAWLLQGPDAKTNYDGEPPPGVTEEDVRQMIDEIERRWFD